MHVRVCVHNSLVCTPACVHDVVVVDRFCTVLRMKLVRNDGNSSMVSFPSHCVNDWLLSTAFEDIHTVACACQVCIE